MGECAKLHSFDHARLDNTQILWITIEFSEIVSIFSMILSIIFICVQDFYLNLDKLYVDYILYS